MSANEYLIEGGKLIEKIRATQIGAIQQAAKSMAASITAGRAVHLYGSGHSVIPVLEIFPRYGS
jgi:uncharacterized phosphosugar-binding protein